MEAVILEFFAAVNRRDLDAIEACYHPDYVSEQPCFPSRIFHGPKAVRKIYEDELYPKVPGVRYDVKRSSFTTSEDGKKVTGFVEVHMTDDNERLNVKGVFIMEADGGLIRHGTLYMTPVHGDVGNIDTYVKGLSRAGAPPEKHG
eukprot:TRINITY_DN1324_c0_g1_i1.p1 TRINITY_DN1324_c0_g1~~TRINITY_DN1324_c0_g1_i1.p1  ORF type:complete len:145 (+),score=17.82 TRINITY_DN1324_c0_g1_i1:530-964(+)